MSDFTTDWAYIPPYEKNRKENLVNTKFLSVACMELF
jgi:hypothetical protein